MKLYWLLCAGLLLAGTVEAGGVDLKDLPPTGIEMPMIQMHDFENMSMKAAGKTPSGKWVPLRVDEEGYVLPTPVQQMDSKGRIKSSPCLQRMREAMKAMDPYTGGWWSNSAINAVMRSRGESLREAADAADREDKIRAQWQAVMRDCVQ